MSINPIQWLKDYATVLIVGALALAIVVLGGKLWAETSAHQKTAQQLADLRVAYAEHLREDAESTRNAEYDYRERERKLQRAADEDKEKKNAQVLALHSELDALAGELRKRPQRPAAANASARSATASAAPAEVQGCTASQLYREDALAALGIAADADELRLDYEELWSGYERVRTELEALKAGPGHGDPAQ